MDDQLYELNVVGSIPLCKASTIRFIIFCKYK